ncbi:mitogen-activated protein kinase kinase 9-like [Iris pallida]|nr:mitogen-activated protein kinase kinase 9-like [Iris pallida]
MDSGSLGDLVRRAPLPEPALAHICGQVLRGLHYLHSQKVVHRDIKPSNLLVGSGGQIKIADFGVSKLLRRSLDACVSYVGTCAYMSPERFDPEAYGGNYDPYAADVWSLGLTVLELFVGRFPLVPEGERPDWAALMCAICFGEPPAMPEGASEELRDFVGCCLQKEAGKRWSVGQLASHPFVARSDRAESERMFRDLLTDGPARPESS